jgi:hypothetical protein
MLAVSYARPPHWLAAVKTRESSPGCDGGFAIHSFAWPRRVDLRLRACAADDHATRRLDREFDVFSAGSDVIVLSCW